MALTYVKTWTASTTNAGGDVTSGSITVAAGDVVLALWASADNQNAGAVSISNTGQSLTWTQRALTNGGSNCKVGVWFAVAGSAGSITVTVAGDGGTVIPGSLAVIVHTGAHATDPVPSAKVFSGTGGTDVSQSITPSASGSCLWMLQADWAATNTFAAIANCTIDDSHNVGGQYTTALLRPTTNPRPDGTAFTVGATDTGATVAWVAVEVQAAPTGQFARPVSDDTAGAWTPSTGTSHFACIDEATADDADYISTTSNTTGAVVLGTISTPDAGTQTLRVRAAGSPAKKLIVRLLEGATARATITVDPLTSTVTAYTATATGITSYAGLKCDYQIADATSPPSPTVSYGAIGTTGSTSATTSVTAAYPSMTGSNAGTALYLVATGRGNTAGTEFAITGGGWTNLGTLEGGTGTWGVDAGTRRVTIFRKDTVTGSESGNVTVTLAGTTSNTLYARILRIDPPAGFTLTDSFASGADTSSGTGYSATASTSLSWQAGDLLLFACALATDSLSISAQSITASGVTFGTRTNRASIAATGGNDHRHYVDTVPVSSGSGSSAPVWAFTTTTSTSGPTAFLRIRAVPPTEFGRLTFLEFQTPDAASGTHSYTGSGGVTVSGAAAVTRGRVWVGTGGASVSGAAAVARTRVWVGSGGVAVSGAGAALFIPNTGQIFSWTGSGGVSVGGTAPVSRTRVWAGSGGASVSGAAAVSRGRAWVGSGGATVSGAAVVSSTMAWAGSGGVTVSGAAAVTRGRVWVGTGGASVSGAAEVARTLAWVGSGGATVSGAGAALFVPDSGQVFSWTGSGGVSVGGTAPVARTRAWAGSGGVQTGGAADVSRARTWAGAGGVVVSGSAAAAFISAAPRTYEYAGSGGVSVGGAALTQGPASAVVEPPASGGGASRRRPRAPSRPPALVYEYIGSGGVRVGGAADTAFAPAPALAAAELARIAQAARAAPMPARFIAAAPSGGLRAPSGRAQVARLWAVPFSDGGLRRASGAAPCALDHSLARIRAEDELLLLDMLE